MSFQRIMALLSLLLCSTHVPRVVASEFDRPPLPELRVVEVPEAAKPRFEGDRFSYMEAGQAISPTVLLLHGIGANSFYWRYLYSSLSKQFRVVAWNAPGYILSDPLRNERPTCDDFAEALDAFAAAVNLPERFALVGNSFGSAIAQCYAAAHPQRVTHLALSGTSVGARMTPPAERESTFARRQKQFERAGGMTYAKEIISLLPGSKTSVRAKAETSEVLALTNGRGYLQASWVPYSFDALDLAPKLTMPVLIYHGSEDKIAPIERSSVALTKVLTNATLVRYEGYGHLPDVEVPDEVSALLLSFLSKQ